MACVEEKIFITSFVRSNECRVKCGDDGKDDVIPSTLFDDLLDVSIVNRSCGCRMVPANRKTNIKDFVQKFCFKLEYYFVKHSIFLNTYNVVCKDCLVETEGQIFCHCIEHHIHDEELPIDLCPATVFYNCTFRPDRLCNASRYRTSPECWKCSLCEGDLYSITNCQYSEVEDDNNYVCNVCCDVDDWECTNPDCPYKTDDLKCNEEMDFNNLYPDSAHFQDLFRKQNNNTPIDQIIKTTYVNSFISDSDLEDRIEDYYNRLTLHDYDDRRVSPNLFTEEAYLQYNGYH